MRRGSFAGSDHGSASSLTDVDKMFPRQLSSADKKAADKNAAMHAALLDKAAVLELEKTTALERADSAETRVSELEVQLTETIRAFEEQIGVVAENARAREAQQAEALRVEEAAAAAAAQAAADMRAALETERSSLRSRLKEATGRLPPLQEQLKQLESAREAEAEKGRGLAERLAQALAEKRGAEELHECYALDESCRNRETRCPQKDEDEDVAFFDREDH